jgi:sarcosine oxidase subunit alpha
VSPEDGAPDEPLDLVVVGGGPAGLTAARDVAAAGGRVVVVEENHAVGGKLRGQLHEDPVAGHWWKGWEIAAEAERAAVAASVRLMTDTLAWGLEPGWTVRLSHPSDRHRSPRRLTSRAVLVATGAVERPAPLPGWTLPGVMTIGAAQVLTNIHRVKPGRRVLVVGVDALSVTIARAMKLAGVDVVGIVLPPAAMPGSSTLSTLGRLAAMTDLAPARYMRWGGKALRWSWSRAAAARLVPRTLRVWGIPLHLRTGLVEIEGADQVTGARLVDTTASGAPVPGSERSVAVDAVCLSNGLAPSNELMATLKGDFFTSPDLGGAVPLHSESLRTQHEGLYVAGNAVGVEGAKVATKQGELAALSIIADLGLRKVSPETIVRCVEELAEVRRTMEFQFNPRTQQGHDAMQRAWEQAVAQR